MRIVPIQMFADIGKSVEEDNGSIRGDEDLNTSYW